MRLVHRHTFTNALPKNSSFLLSTFIFTVTLSPSYSLIQIDITVTCEWRWLLYVILPFSPIRLVHRHTFINALPKNSPPDCFLNGRFQVPSSLACKIEKTWYTRYQVFSMVRVTGLEPVRRETHAPQTCLSAYSSTLAFISHFFREQYWLYGKTVILSILF